MNKREAYLAKGYSTNPDQGDMEPDKVFSYNVSNRVKYDCLHDFFEKEHCLDLRVQNHKNDIFPALELPPRL